MKLNLSNKKTNLIVTAVIALVVIVVGIFASITFVSYYNFETEFIVNPTVDHIEHLSDYSPSIKGTINDIEIYVFCGTDNTVALVKASEVNDYADVSKIPSSAVILADVNQVENVADAEALVVKNYTKQSKETAINAVKTGSANVALVSYADAKAAVASDATLAIAKAEVERVPSMLLLGGTHPNEPSGQLTATLIMENISAQRGKFFIITELNRSGFSYSQQQEGWPMYYTIKTQNGSIRTFRFGSRLTNTVDQRLVPDVYAHLSGQQLAAEEVRNYNRTYPGSPTGTYTERCTYGIVELIKQNNVTIEIDLHEAAPEYMTNNTIVYHQDSAGLQSVMKLEYMYDEQYGKIKMSYDESPTNKRGLTHREIGDYTNAYAFLCETCECVEGRIHGALTDNLTLYYPDNTDKFYEYLVKRDKENGVSGGKGGTIYVAPVSIDERVARHTLSVMSILDAFNDDPCARTEYAFSELPENERNTAENAYRGVFKLSQIPSYGDILNNGCGYYLKDSQR